MKFFTAKMPESYELIFFGDEQEGNISFSQDGLNECIGYILDKPNRFCIHMGDATDSFYFEDAKRYNPGTVVKSPLEQVESHIKNMTPLVKENRLLTKLIGNHEWSLFRKAGDITEYACNELSKLNSNVFLGYGTFSSKIEFYDNKGLQFKTYVTHGRKLIHSASPDPVRKKAYMQFTLRKQLESMFGDCLLMVKGHAHKVLVSKPEPALYLTTEGGKIKQHYTKAGTGSTDLYIPPENRWYGCSGSFLKTFHEGVSTYAEMYELPPTEIGYIKAIIQDRELVDVVEVKIQ